MAGLTLRSHPHDARRRRPRRRPRRQGDHRPPPISASSPWASSTTIRSRPAPPTSSPSSPPSALRPPRRQASPHHLAAASGQEIRRLKQLCDDAALPVKIIPGIFEIVGGKVNLSRIREVAIEDRGRDRLRVSDEVLHLVAHLENGDCSGCNGVPCGALWAGHLARRHRVHLPIPAQSRFSTPDASRCTHASSGAPEFVQLS